jgi:ABC-2 type transport system permease protein
MLSFAVARRILTELLHSRRSIVFWILFPTLMLLLFGFVYAEGAGGRADSFNFMAPSILIGAALFFSCLAGPISTLVAERERNTLKRLLLSPMDGTSYFLGVTLAYLIVAAFQTVIIYGIAFAFGASFMGSVPLGAAIILLSVTSYVGLGFFFGSRFAKRAEDVNGPVSAIGVPLLVLGGTFFPTSMLPPFLLTAAQFNPIFHMNEAMDAVSALGSGASDIVDHLVFLVVFSVLSVLLGAQSYRAMLAREQTL